MIALFNCSAFAASSEKVRLQLKWFHQFQFAGYYAALSKDFYQEEGLDVEILEGAAEILPSQLVLEGKADFGVHDGAHLIYRRLQGDPLVAVAAIFQHSPVALLSKKSSNIRHPADLIGRRIGVDQNQGAVSLLAMFRHEGVDVKSIYDLTPVHFVSMPGGEDSVIDDLAEGRFAALEVYLTHLPSPKHGNEFEPIIMNPLDYGVDFYGDTLFTSNAILEAKPDVVERFRRASVKGWKYALEHREEIANFILTFPTTRPTKKNDRQMLLAEAEALNNIILPTLVEIGHMNPGRWERMADIYRELRMVTSTSRLEGFIYDIDNEKKRLRKQLQFLGIIMAVVALTTTFSFIWIRLLRSQVRVRTKELIEDIAERKRAEEALQKSETLLNSTQRLTKVGGWEFDVKSGKSFWTDELYRIHEIPNDPSIDHVKESLACYGPEERRILNEAFQRACEQGESYDLELPFTTCMGKPLWIRTTAQPVYENGKVVRIIGNLLDITERKRSEDVVQISSERLQLATRVACIGIWDWDVAKNELVWDDSMYQLYGIQREDFSGAYDAWIRTVHPDDKAHTDGEIQAALRGEREYAPEFRIIRPDGSIRYIKADSRTIKDQEGKPLRMIGTNIDITEHKRAEEKIRQLNQDLEQRVTKRTVQLEISNKELEAFAYSVSHDLRAPLRHIDGFLDMLNARIGATLDAKSLHYMDIISDSAKRMGTLIDDLLAFSRTARCEMTTTNVDLRALIQEIIQDIAPEIQGRSIDWRIGDLPVVTGDRAMLRIALVNLISNAVKFTQKREKADIEIGCLPESESDVTVFVRDNGAGFDMRYVDKLFGVFQRLHRMEDFEGTGIGLANVHRIISRHGGKTWAEGKIDGGATFYFSLPRCGPPQFPSTDHEKTG
jgi:PAS domain S-box-containing protein